MVKSDGWERGWAGIWGRKEDILSMDARMLDVTTGIVSLAVFIITLIFLPKIMPAPQWQGMAYIIAIVVYITFMTGTGFLIREKIA
jgi:hypothetical protein